VAKGRKPAIDGLARPQGILDDVVYPIAQKAGRQIQKAARRTGAYNAWRKASELEARASSRRGTSYVNKMDKAYGKMEIAIEEGRDAAARRNAGKVVLNQKKLAAKNTPNASVRRAAKAQRARNRFQTKIEKGRR
jgi:hypothetical protein